MNSLQRTLLLVLIATLLLLGACSDEAGGSNTAQGTSDTRGGDTSNDTRAGDTSGDDTSADTTSADTSGNDTSNADTSGGDTSNADTSGGDTSNADTSNVPVPGVVGEVCSADLPCEETLTCAAGLCALGGDTCVDDSECDGDTYCCAEGCEPSNVCIPYGEGPRENLNNECTGQITIGVFEPSVQCEWTGPPEGDPFPDHINVLGTPMVMDLPHDSGAAAEIIFISYNFTDGGSQAAAGSDPNYFGVIRIINGQTCEQLESIHDPAHPVIASSPPALADIDGDGDVEIVAQEAQTGMVAFTWSPENNAYETLWSSSGSSDIVGVNRWDGPSIHNLGDDNIAEVISGGEVYNGMTGARLNVGQTVSHSGILSVLADIDQDGIIELVVGSIYEWDSSTKMWVPDHLGAPNLGNESRRHRAVADFGTPGATAADFDFTQLDGIAEIVSVIDNSVQLHTLSGQELMNIPGIIGGGPPTIGDFDADGFPEITAAGGSNFWLYDPDCIDETTPGCLMHHVRWQQASQDSSSRTTGSSIFDFDGDGQAEALYADECFTRIYDGQSGDVLYSAFRTSCTWYENAVVADPDRDQNTEILVSSNNNCNVGCPEIDPIHPGIRCESGADCPSGGCVEGLCRCITDEECTSETHCVAPISAPEQGNTCRAYHPPGVGLTGVRVLRDRLDRWASSRPIWNQHTYTVGNINDDGTVPTLSEWIQSFSEGGANNYRQNSQGSAGSEDFPDITGRFNADEICRFGDGGEISIVSTVCNRGHRSVGAALPATFYMGDPAEGNVLCTSYTEGPVPVGGCLEVSCVISEEISGQITVIVNDDGAGGQTTVECNSDNNSDTIVVEECQIF